MCIGSDIEQLAVGARCKTAINLRGSIKDTELQKPFGDFKSSGTVPHLLSTFFFLQFFLFLLLCFADSV